MPVLITHNAFYWEGRQEAHLMAVVDKARPVQAGESTFYAEERQWLAGSWILWPCGYVCPLQMLVLVAGPCKLLQPRLHTCRIW